MKDIRWVLISLAISMSVSSSAWAEPAGCETKKKIVETDADPLRFIGPGIFGLFDKPPPNVYVPFKFRTMNRMTLQDRYEPELGLDACAAKIKGCVGEIASNPSIHFFCLKSDGKKRLEQIIRVN